jgi:hypothetical protein
MFILVSPFSAGFQTLSFCIVQVTAPGFVFGFDLTNEGVRPSLPNLYFSQKLKDSLLHASARGGE